MNGPNRYEYMLLTFKTLAPYEAVEEKLNKVGREGWELIAGTSSGEDTRYCFRRPLGVAWEYVGRGSR